MKSLIERLPARIKRLEQKHGSDDPYVKDLKRQLAAMKANKGKSSRQVYLMGAKDREPSRAADFQGFLQRADEQIGKEAVDQMSAESPSEPSTDQEDNHEK